MKIINSVKAVFLSAILLCCSLVQADTPPVSDADLMASIQSQYAKDNTTADTQVQVTAKNGVVNLAGKVNTESEADKLIQIAGATPGVSDVLTTDLSVKESKHTMNDVAITAKVKVIYLREKVFGDKDISMLGVNVETTDGVVTLTGTVDTQAEIANAVKYAEGVQGVKKVESKLVVKEAS